MKIHLIEKTSNYVSSQCKYTNVTVSGIGRLLLCLSLRDSSVLILRFHVQIISLLFSKSLILIHCDVEISAAIK